MMLHLTAWPDTWMDCVNRLFASGLVCMQACFGPSVAKTQSSCAAQHLIYMLSHVMDLVGCRWVLKTTSYVRCLVVWTPLWQPHWCTRWWATACTACLWTTGCCATRFVSSCSACIGGMCRFSATLLPCAVWDVHRVMVCVPVGVAVAIACCTLSHGDGLHGRHT